VKSAGLATFSPSGGQVSRAAAGGQGRRDGAGGGGWRGREWGAGGRGGGVSGKRAVTSGTHQSGERVRGPGGGFKKGGPGAAQSGAGRREKGPFDD
jgi:hypothetical protein